MKKKLSKTLGLCALALSCGLLLLGSNQKDYVRVSAADTTPTYSVSYHYWRTDIPSLGRNGTNQFNTLSEFRTWTNKMLEETCQNHTFSSFTLTLNGDADFFFVKSYDATYNINNHNFNIVDANNNKLTNITFDSGTSLYFTLKKATIPANWIWNIKGGTCVEFEECVIDGENKSYAQDIFNIDRSGCFAGYKTTIKNFNLVGDTEIFDIIGDENGERFTAVNGIWKQDSLTLENIHANDRNGIITVQSNACIANSVFINCSSKCGGALYVKSGEVYHCSFTNCYATTDEGGAVYLESGCINESTFTKCYTCDDDGGAVYMDGDNTTVSDCAFIENEAHVDGGAICVSGDNACILNSEFTNNHAKDDGGAIYVCRGTDDTCIRNCTFTGNHADDDCDDIDGRSDTTVDGSRFGSIISEGSIFIIVEVATVLIAVAVILIVLKKRPKVVTESNQKESK